MELTRKLGRRARQGECSHVFTQGRGAPQSVDQQPIDVFRRPAGGVGCGDLKPRSTHGGIPGETGPERMANHRVAANQVQQAVHTERGHQGPGTRPPPTPWAIPPAHRKPHNHPGRSTGCAACPGRGASGCWECCSRLAQESARRKSPPMARVLRHRAIARSTVSRPPPPPRPPGKGSTPSPVHAPHRHPTRWPSGPARRQSHPPQATTPTTGRRARPWPAQRRRARGTAPEAIAQATATPHGPTAAHVAPLQRRQGLAPDIFNAHWPTRSTDFSARPKRPTRRRPDHRLRMTATKSPLWTATESYSFEPGRKPTRPSNLRPHARAREDQNRLSEKWHQAATGRSQHGQMLRTFSHGSVDGRLHPGTHVREGPRT